MSGITIETYYYSKKIYDSAEERLNYTSLNQTDNHNYLSSKSVDIYGDGDIKAGKFLTNSTYFYYKNNINDVNDIIYLRNVNISVVTNNGLLGGIYIQKNQRVTLGKPLIFKPVYKTNNYEGKDVKCIIEAVDDGEIIRKLTIVSI